MTHSTGSVSRIREHLFRLDGPLLRIPTLAIHLDRSVQDGFKFNTETHLVPVLGSRAVGGAAADVDTLIRAQLSLDGEAHGSS